MKKILLALAAVAAMTGSASAADLGARPYTKAPMAGPVANWTGFYVFGGGGGGLWNADSGVNSTGAVTAPFGGFGPAGTPLIRDQRLEAVAGSERSVSVMTGKSTQPGSSALLPTANSVTSVAR